MVEVGRMKTTAVRILWSVLLIVSGISLNAIGEAFGGVSTVPLSRETELCIECHKTYNPGIVSDWLESRHARVSPVVALARPALEKRVSARNVPERLKNVAVGCYECHGLNTPAHKDSFDHFDTRINLIVSPQDCKTCHEEEAEQYSKGKKAHAIDNLDKNSLNRTLMDAILGKKKVEKGKVVGLPAGENTKNETCYACHGTRVDVKATRTVNTDLGDITVPELTNWPNHGVGRINPDGSMGACSSCHPRHSFSIETARKPYTCAQCHLEPDIPAWNVYKESKHGNIFLSRGASWRFEPVPWVVGKDFRAPTCAACHNSLVVTEDGTVLRKRTHNFGDRLWVRIFGLIYSHPQTLDGRTYLIRNKDGLPLPTTFSGEPASSFLIDGKEQKVRQDGMVKLCTACHGSGYGKLHFSRLDHTIKETDSMVRRSTDMLMEGWTRKIADRTNPFDEKLEQKWVLQWLFYANSIRFGSAMSGPDYATFKNGWWNSTATFEEMRSMVKPRKR